MKVLNKVLIGVASVAMLTACASKTDYDTFKSLEDFLSALDYVIKIYPSTAAMGLTWKLKVETAYNAYYKESLSIPLWQDIFKNYPKK